MLLQLFLAVSHPPLAAEHLADGGPGDEVVVALVPLVPVLPHERRVVPGVKAAHVVHNRKQRIPEQKKVRETNDATD